MDRGMLKEALREAFNAGREQGNDEAVSFDWGSRPSQSADEAFADLFKEWNMADSPFSTCRAEGAEVRSAFWHLKAANAAQAKRICEVIRGAYEAGRRDYQNEIRMLLIGPDVENL